MIACICTGKYKGGQVDGKTTVSFCREEEINSTKKESKR